MAPLCYCGWQVSPDGAGIDRGFSVAGVTFPGGVKTGDVSTAFRYLLTEFDQRVEGLVAGWCWGYSYKENANSPGSFSCHAAGVAVDVNAPLHGNGGAQYEGFSDAQVKQIRAILAECPVFQWGADYSGTKDAMHFEVIVDSATLARVVDGLPEQGDDDMPLSADDIEKVADAVIKKMREEDVVQYNKTDAGSGKETQIKGSITDALGTAATYAGRAAYRATNVDNKT